MKISKKNRDSFVFFMILGFLLINTSAIAALPTTDVTISKPNPVVGYYILHWPEKNADIYFNERFIGRIENHSLIVPIPAGTQKYSRYSVVSANRTVFSDILPAAPVSGEYVEVFPRWIQNSRSGHALNETVRTYQIYWPDDGVLVDIDGVYQGTIRNGLCRIEIPGRDIPGHPDYPKKIAFRYPDSTREQTFFIDIIPAVGGSTDYYLYWSSPFMYPREIPRKREQKTVPDPIWINRFDADDLDISLSSSGDFVAIGTQYTGIARMFSSLGDALWSYHDPGKTLLVAVSENGDLCTIASRKDAYTVEESTGEVLLIGRNGTILWKRTLEHGANSVAISPDGSSILVTAGHSIEVFDQKGERTNTYPINYAWSQPAFADGKWIVSPGTGSILYIASNGSLIWSYPVNERILGTSLSSDGNSGAAISDDHLYSFTRTGEVVWQKPSKYRFTDVDVSGDGMYITASSQYRLLFYDKSGNLLWQKEHSGYVHSVSVTGDGRKIVAVFDPGLLMLLNYDGSKIWDYRLPETLPAISRAVISQNGRFIAMNEGGRLYFFNEWGNGTIIKGDEPTDTTKPTPLPDYSQTRTTPKPSPLPELISLIALAISGITGICLRRFQ